MPVVTYTFVLILVELDSVKKAGQQALALLCCLCLVFAGGYTIAFTLTGDEDLDSWSGLSFYNMNVVEDLQDCLDLMQEEEYTHALINYWYASPMAELSSGQINVAPVEFTFSYDDEDSLITLYTWGMPKSTFLPENLPDELVVFVEWEEDLPTFLDRFPDAELVWESSPFSACVISKDMLTQP